VNENFKFLFSKKNLISSVFLKRVILTLLFLFIFFNSYQRYEKYSNEVLAFIINPNVIVVSIAAPTGLAATPISSSQIDLVWNSVSGADYYKVYRDGSFAASTAQLSYSDTGLSPVTTYTYTVSAFSNTLGESFQSSPAQATTLSLPEEGRREGGAIFIPPPPPKNISLTINNGNIYTNSRKVDLQLFAQSASDMAISNRFDFEGSVWEKYQTSTSRVLEEGDGEKKVYAKFKSISGGVSEVVSDSIILDTVAPLNISNLEAVTGDQQISLKWENPPDRDFEGVKIMGSIDFYPSSPSEGTPIYEGKETDLLIIGLTNQVRHYYTVFSYDQAGNFSSGALVSATPFKITPPPPPPSPPPLPPPPPEIEKIIPQDFIFQQEEKEIPPQEVEKKINIKAEAGKPLTISLDYEKVPEVLKTIMVTLEKEGKSFSFLLRINSQKTKYEAALLIPQEPGIYNLTIDILDYKNQNLKKIIGYLDVGESEVFPSPLIPWYRSFKNWFLIISGTILIILISYLVLRIRMKQLEERY